MGEWGLRLQSGVPSLHSILNRSYLSFELVLQTDAGGRCVADVGMQRFSTAANQLFAISDRSADADDY
jgi:hypothetical protein